MRRLKNNNYWHLGLGLNLFFGHYRQTEFQSDPFLKILDVFRLMVDKEGRDVRRVRFIFNIIVIFAVDDKTPLRMNKHSPASRD